MFSSTSTRFGLSALGALLSGCTCQSTKSASNIVLIVIDTLRADHLETYGYSRSTAPELANFASSAAVFDRAYSHSSWTKPSVSSLLTSLEPAHHGVGDWDHTFDPKLMTLQKHLKSLGYRTEAVVSHHAFNPKYNNFHLNFDVFDTSPYAGRGSPHNIASSREVTDATIAALDRHAQTPQPFFQWVHYFDPHDTYLKHPEHDFGDRAIDRYDSEIAHTDEHLARLLERLDQDDLRANTVVAITADHGEEFRDHGKTKHTLTLYEEVLHVPLMLRAPGLDAVHIPQTVGQIDLPPTLLELVDVPIPKDFAGTPIPNQGGELYLPEHRPVFGEARRQADKRSMVEGPWKIIHDRVADTWELFNLESDPKERHNLFPPRLTQQTASTHGHPMAPVLKKRLEEHFQDPGREAMTEPLDSELSEVLEQLGYLEASD